MVLRFTDSTADELHQGLGRHGPARQQLRAKRRRRCKASCGITLKGCISRQSSTLYFKRFYGNLDLRLLEDVLSPARADTSWPQFTAIKNRSPFLYPRSARRRSRSLLKKWRCSNWDSADEAEAIPLAFHRAAEYAGGTASGNEHNAAYKILSENLDVTIEKSGLPQRRGHG